MQVARFTLLVLAAGWFAGCGDNSSRLMVDGGNAANFPTNRCADVKAAHCIEITGGDSAVLQTQANSITAGTTLVLGVGTFSLNNQITIRTAGTHIIGQGIDRTVLDFTTTTTQSNGVDVVGDDFLIQDLTVRNSPKDGIRVEASKGVVYRRIRATWATASSPNNGAYGIYPVKSQNVLVENSRAENASDAGLYVGQCQHVIVRNNTVTGNVAGLEIENTEYADVYGNTAEDNTGGILVFDLPGNPIIGRDVRVHDNTIRNNNHVNFASGGTVANIPVGTGTFAMASRRVEITRNTYANNNTGDIALISGLVVEPDATRWTLPTSTLSGTYADLGLLPGATSGTVMNFRAENIMVAGNHHSGSGTKPDTNSRLGTGQLLAAYYGTSAVDSVLYDAIGETFDPEDAGVNTNNNHICVGGNTEGTFASLDLAEQTATTLVPFFRPAAPFAPYQCTALSGGPVGDVTLP